MFKETESVFSHSKSVTADNAIDCGPARLPVTLEADFNVAEQKEDYDQILNKLISDPEAISMDDTLQLLAELFEIRKQIGVHNKYLLSKFDLKNMLKMVSSGDEKQKRYLLKTLAKYIALQEELRFNRSPSSEDVQRLSKQIYDVYLSMLKLYPHCLRVVFRKKRIEKQLRWINAADSSMAFIGKHSCRLGTRLRNVNTGIKWIDKSFSMISFVLLNFFSYQSLRKTQFETSWGWRHYIPGTLGMAGNMGGWVMMATGNLDDLQGLSEPMRVNPGATFYLPWVVGTANRPGFGWGPVTPIASAYTDKHRFKLLVGIDGVLYVRVGEWAHRGSYFTVSASIPVLPGTSITWNASLFSPGFELLLRYVTPYSHKIQHYSEIFYAKVSYPVKLVKMGLNKLMFK